VNWVLVFRLAASLGAGALVTIIVSWMLAALPPMNPGPVRPITVWPPDTPPSWRARAARPEPSAASAGALGSWRSAAFAEGEGWSAGIYDFRFGWPALALQSLTAASIERGKAEEVSKAWAPIPEWILPQNGNVPVFGFPVVPLWRGFLLDTGVYGAFAFALSFVPGAVRRRMRAARGLCPSCRYDLSGLPPGSPCPECAAKPPNH
jgi:hypothetical protein